eukprot:scaffold742_cov395-Prasinococcus_capsulatus_cf.AAC.20
MSRESVEALVEDVLDDAAALGALDCLVGAALNTSRSSKPLGLAPLLFLAGEVTGVLLMPSKSTLSARPLDVVDVWSWAAALAPPRNSSTALARAGLPAPTGVGAGGPPPKKSTASPWPLEAISDALAILAMPELLKLYKSSRSDAETLGDTLAVLGWEILRPQAR